MPDLCYTYCTTTTITDVQRRECSVDLHRLYQPPADHRTNPRPDGAADHLGCAQAGGLAAVRAAVGDRPVDQPEHDPEGVQRDGAARDHRVGEGAGQLRSVRPVKRAGRFAREADGYARRGRALRQAAFAHPPNWARRWLRCGTASRVRAEGADASIF